MSNDIRKYIDRVKRNLLTEDSSKLIGYHVTSKNYLKNIQTSGLIPNIPQDYGDNGDVEGVYLFKSLDDAKNALYNWLGERIEDWEEENQTPFDEITLQVNLSGLEQYLIDSVEYEWICTTTIEPERILDIFIL